MQNATQNPTANRRIKIAAELMRDCPAESRVDHAIIANAIRLGATLDQLLAMPETNRWPETYRWMKNEFSATIKYSAE